MRAADESRHTAPAVAERPRPAVVRQLVDRGPNVVDAEAQMVKSLTVRSQPPCDLRV
jgi:hypothetical protein